MLSFDSIPSIYIAQGPTDLRKGMDQLASLVQNRYELNPFENCLYIFCNRTRDKLKMLYWDGSGFWLLNKRLEEGKFQWDKHRTGCISITHQQLRWLLEGLSMSQNKAFKSKSYEAV